MKAYKGFDKDLKCKDFQYEIGKTYEEPKAQLFKKGFHACEYRWMFLVIIPHHATVLQKLSWMKFPMRNQTILIAAAKKFASKRKLALPGL